MDLHIGERFDDYNHTDEKSGIQEIAEIIERIPRMARKV